MTILKAMVIRAQVLGYCMGVRRAVETALNTLNKYPNHSVYTLGPLIHNKDAIEMLKSKGLEILDVSAVNKLNTKEKPTVVILSAHGTPYSLKQDLEDIGVIVVDATCPRVLANQKKMYGYASQGFPVFIAGDKSHGEVFALVGSIPNDCECFVFQNAIEAKDFISTKKDVYSKAVVISQTTITQDEYNEVCSVLQSEIENIIILDTICPATLERQKALKEMFEKVEALIVIGGKNSANTTRLYQIAKELGDKGETLVPVCHIESAKEIPDEFFKLKCVGITAGASTPDEVISEVEAILLQKKGAQ